MSPPDAETAAPAAGLKDIRGLMDEWIAGLAQLLESMTGQKPKVQWRASSQTPADAGAGADAEVLWWEQAFQFSSESVVWVGAPRAAWEHIAAFMLKAAGLDSVQESDGGPDAEARKTWQEILCQWLSLLARSLTPLLGREVACAAGSEHAPPAGQREWGSVALEFEDGATATLAIAVSAALLALLAAPRAEAQPETDSSAPQVPCTMDLLMDVELPVSISFGRTELPLKEVLKLTTGSIVELNRAVNDPVEILVNHCLVARGEVVVIDGNYGVRPADRQPAGTPAQPPLACRALCAPDETRPCVP